VGSGFFAVRWFGKLISHFEEEQEGDLLQVITVAYAVVAEDVGEIPDFGDEGGGVAHKLLINNSQKWFKKVY